MKAKVIVNFVLIICGIVGLVILLGTWKKFGSFVMAASSVKKISDHFYYMEFKGDTKLKEYMESGGADSNEKMALYIQNLLQGKDIKKIYKKKVPLDTGCAEL